MLEMYGPFEMNFKRVFFRIHGGSEKNKIKVKKLLTK